jgi:hypothetical protein
VAKKWRRNSELLVNSLLSSSSHLLFFLFPPPLLPSQQKMDISQTALDRLLAGALDAMWMDPELIVPLLERKASTEVRGNSKRMTVLQMALKNINFYPLIEPALTAGADVGAEYVDTRSLAGGFSKHAIWSHASYNWGGEIATSAFFEETQELACFELLCFDVDHTAECDDGAELFVDQYRVVQQYVVDYQRDVMQILHEKKMVDESMEKILGFMGLLIIPTIVNSGVDAQDGAVQPVMMPKNVSVAKEYWKMATKNVPELVTKFAEREAESAAHNHYADWYM